MSFRNATTWTAPGTGAKLSRLRDRCSDMGVAQHLESLISNYGDIYSPLRLSPVETAPLSEYDYQRLVCATFDEHIKATAKPQVIARGEMLS